MSAVIPGFTPTIPPASPSQTSTTGTNALSSSDFLKLMLTQLQQQDPLNPTDSNQLLTQMSQISTLQSNTTLQQSLQGMTLQQSIGAAGNMIGKTVQGLDATGASVQGVVTSVKIQNQNALLELDSNAELPMSNVTGIAATSPASAASAAAAAATALANGTSAATGTTAPAGTSATLAQQLMALLSGAK